MTWSSPGRERSAWKSCSSIPTSKLVVAPIGGGGLIGGIACAVKETNPKVKIIGVQPARLPSMKAAIAEGKSGDACSRGDHR